MNDIANEEVLPERSDCAKMKEEWAEVEHLANEGVSRVRSEMAMSVVESVERRRSQLDSIEVKLRQERESALS